MDWESGLLPESVSPMEILVLSTVVGVGGLCGLFVASHRKAGPGEALVVTRGGAPMRVSFGRAWVVPGVQRAEVLDMSVRKVVVERRGREGLSCRDGIRVDVRATFQVRVAPVEAEVLRVAREVGCARANTPEQLHELLEAHFAAALAQSVSTFSFEELMADRGLFIDHVGMELGGDLLGFQLERMSLGRLEQTPLDRLDPTNEQDARGIQKLNERAAPLSVEARGARAWSEPPLPGGGEDELEREVDRALGGPPRRD